MTEIQFSPRRSLPTWREWILVDLVPIILVVLMLRLLAWDSERQKMRL